MRLTHLGWLVTLGALAMTTACRQPDPLHDVSTTTWLAREVGGQAVAPGLQSTLRIDADGDVAGNAGCNRFTGSATVTGSEIRFGALATTRRACPPPAMDEEQRYLAALAAARRFVIEDETLRLRDEDDHDLVRFIPTDVPD